MTITYASRLTAGLCGLLISTAVLAQNLTNRDREFLEQAAQNGHAELSASRLALEKTRNEQVRTFAQRMVDEHTRSNDELNALAASKNYQPPTEPSMLQKGKEMLISGLSDDNFDRRYINQMGVEAHEDNIELFDRASREAQDADVKAFATKSLPQLRSHLEAARSLKSALDAGQGNRR
jgi:putative membrane protein